MWKISRQLTWNASGHTAAVWGTTEPCDWQWGSILWTHQEMFARARRQVWEYVPDSCGSWRRGSYSSCIWQLQKSQRSVGPPQAPLASQILQQGWVGGGGCLKGEGGAETEPALSYQPGSVKQGRGERVSQSIWSRPTNSERCLKKTGRSGKTSGKLIWDTAHMSSESPFEMKPCLTASLPTSAISLVLPEGMCKHLRVCICARVSSLYVTVLTTGLPGERVSAPATVTLKKEV